MPSSAQLQGAGLIPPLSTGDTTTAGGDERSTGQEGSSINQQAPGVSSTITVPLTQTNTSTCKDTAISSTDYIDFNELLPARGLSKAVPRASGSCASRRPGNITEAYPELETCMISVFRPLYAAVRISDKPSLAGDLIAYFYSIATMARKHPWPS